MALSEKSRSSLYVGLTSLVADEQAVEEMLSYFPARDVEEPATKEFVRAESAITRTELALTREELKTEMASLRTDLHHEMDELRTELKTDMADLRTELHHEMNQLRTDLRGEMNQLRDRNGRTPHRDGRSIRGPRWNGWCARCRRGWSALRSRSAA